MENVSKWWMLIGSDDDEVANFSFNDSDDDDNNAKFEHFGPEKINLNWNILCNLSLSDFSPNSDRDFPNNLCSGCVRNGSDVYGKNWIEQGCYTCILYTGTL